MSFQKLGQGWSSSSVFELRHISKMTCVLLGVVLLVGCGKSSNNNPKTYPVTGTILMDGAPVAGAYVTFESSSEPKQTAYALTDDLGVFRLTTFATNDGAVEGTHRVKVTKLEAVASSGDSGSVPPGGASKPKPKPKSLIPEKYADYGTSGFSAVVDPKESKKFEFVIHK